MTVFVKAELKAKLAQKEMNVEMLAGLTGHTVPTLYRKMAEGSFTLQDIDQIRDSLELSDKDVISIFFASDVSYCETEEGGAT